MFFDINIHNGPADDAEVELLALPPSGGGSNLLEPNGSQINDIFNYITICMYACMYVSRSLQGRVQVGSLQGSLASVRFKVRSHRIAPRSDCKYDDGNDDDSDDGDGDGDGDDDDGDGDDVPPTPFFFA